MHLARENFSFSVAVGLVLGIAFALLGAIFMEPLLHLLGATPLLFPYCRDYLFILVLASPLAVFQVLFQTYFVTAGKPQLGLVVTVLGGLSNIFFWTMCSLWSSIWGCPAQPWLLPLAMPSPDCSALYTSW